MESGVETVKKKEEKNYPRHKRRFRIVNISKNFSKPKFFKLFSHDEITVFELGDKIRFKKGMAASVVYNTKTRELFRFSMLSERRGISFKFPS